MKDWLVEAWLLVCSQQNYPCLYTVEHEVNKLTFIIGHITNLQWIYSTFSLNAAIPGFNIYLRYPFQTCFLRYSLNHKFPGYFFSRKFILFQYQEKIMVGIESILDTLWTYNSYSEKSATASISISYRGLLIRSSSFINFVKLAESYKLIISFTEELGDRGRVLAAESKNWGFVCVSLLCYKSNILLE